MAQLTRFRSHAYIHSSTGANQTITVAADSRYRLFVNGALVSVGPAKPSSDSWFIDTVDVGPHVKTGMNVFGIELLTYPGGTAGNMSLRRSTTPGLSLEGDVGDKNLSDPSAWRYQRAMGRQFLQGISTQFLGIQESVQGALEPQGWLAPDFDDSSWDTATATTRPSPDPLGALTHRPIPPLALEPVQIQGISRQSGEDSSWNGFLRDEAVTIGAHQRVEVDLDAGTLMTAFLALEVSDGQGATVTLTAAECYEGDPIYYPWLRRKSLRTDAVNGDLYGDSDTFSIAGSGTSARPEKFAPFWFRTLRYLRVTVETLDTPITLHRLALTRTHYPLAVTGSFRSSSDLDTRLWDTSINTLLNCMHETFEDCPYYEQLQYTMDTRSQALFSLHLSADDRLIRRAIRDFAASGDVRGLPESRTPSVGPQIIPGFSLYWIFMVAEHLEHVGDKDFTALFAERVHTVLSVFQDALDESGFVIAPPDMEPAKGQPQVWNFVDWTDEWRETLGVPNLGDRHASTILTLQYVAALKAAAQMAASCADDEHSNEYRKRADDVLRRLSKSSAWDPKTRYFRDSDSGTPASQHAQVWAVLAGFVAGEQARDLLTRAVQDPSLAACSYATSHSLFEALRIAGIHDLVDWQPWAEMLELGLTTWVEDTVSQRSDCHAWGSVPLHHFPRWVLGVRPTGAGFSTVAIDPSPSTLDHAMGTVPTPRGDIRVRWQQHEAGVLSVTAELPLGVHFEASPRHTNLVMSVQGNMQLCTFDHAAGVVQVPPAAGRRTDNPIRQDLAMRPATNAVDMP